MDGREDPVRPETPGPGDAARPLAAFDEHRPLLFSIAYRMLGSVADAEDALQEAFVRWQRVPGAEVDSPRAYLSSVVTRLCIDQLRSARARREEYVGPWLPEPIPTGPVSDLSETVILEESLSMAFLVLLESLTPTERAVFLLREVFDYEYAEVSRLVGKSEDNCRQILRRACQSVAARRPRFDGSPERERRLVESFLAVCAGGDVEGLISLLEEDVTLYTDGGGRVIAAPNPIHGPDNVARFVLGIFAKSPPGLIIRPSGVNGRPGIIGYFADGRPQGVVTFEAHEGRIRAIHIVVNPEKLGGIPPLEETA
jgi:RNA polymerase sigma-70 factor, ECF subfamily